MFFFPAWLPPSYIDVYLFLNDIYNDLSWVMAIIIPFRSWFIVYFSVNNCNVYVILLVWSWTSVRIGVITHVAVVHLSIYANISIGEEISLINTIRHLFLQTIKTQQSFLPTSGALLSCLECCIMYVKLH